MPENRQWIVTRPPKGAPTLDDLEYSKSPVPELTKDGAFLVRICDMSLDPYIRGTMNPVSYGRKQKYPRVMTCGAVGQVVKSRNPKFPVGAIVNGQFGWRDYAVSTGQGVRILPPHWKRTWALGVLGMPGATAFLGLTEIINPKKGETIVVSSCTGAVGMLVGQIAKILGCHTVGFTSPQKLDLAKSMGYDHVINYRGKDVRQLKKELRAVAPNGVNGYFDNAGGPCTEAVLQCLALQARVAVCGQIAYYNLKNPASARAYPATMIALTSCSKIEGFLVNMLPKRDPGNWDAAFEKLYGWLESGQLKVKEDVTEDLDNAFEAFLTLFHGIGKKSNVGKKVVHVAEPDLPLLNPAKL